MLSAIFNPYAPGIVETDVTWQVISFQWGIMTSVVGSGVIEHGLESYGKIDVSGQVSILDM
jgi:hypothetical protein